MIQINGQPPLLRIISSTCTTRRWTPSAVPEGCAVNAEEGDHGSDYLLEVLAEELDELAKIVAREQAHEAAARR